jgi:excisionase family DNA binding protein
MSDATDQPTDSSSIMGRFLTVAEVARALRISNMTVYRLINSGQIGAVRVGRGYRIPEDEIRRYLQRRYMDTG